MRRRVGPEPLRHEYPINTAAHSAEQDSIQGFGENSPDRLKNQTLSSCSAIDWRISSRTRAAASLPFSASRQPASATR